jgi:DNA polymerase III subunit delta
MKFEEILSSLSGKNYQPVYFLMGEETYYIDEISNYISKNVLSESERDFNQSILYGKDTDAASIISACKQFPLMGQHTVVIVKEAQDLKKIEDLEIYINNPLLSTILVLCYKNKSLDKRKKFGKEIAKKAVVFESKKLYDNQVPAWIQEYLKKKNYKIQLKAAHLLAEFVGTSLSKITNELDKLMIITLPSVEITSEMIEKNIGISKDFNIFELNKAIGTKDVLKANRIANYFAENPKEHPLVMTVGTLFNYFQKILLYQTLKDKSKSNVASILKVNPFFVSDYVNAARLFSKTKNLEIISLLRKYDLKSKGVDNQSTTDGELLKELLFKILH